MYREKLESLRVNQAINVDQNIQVWRNNATKLHKETGKIFHIKKIKGFALIIRLV